MKGLFISVGILIALAAISFAAEDHSFSTTRFLDRGTEMRVNRGGHSLDEIVYWEGWESGSLSGWTPSDGLWRIVRDTSATNGTLIVVCNDSTTGVYPPGVATTLTSPFLDLRSVSGGALVANIMFSGYLPSQQTYPDCDWWMIEVTRDSGATWCNAFNPTCDPIGVDPVFNDCPSQWQEFFEPFFFDSLMGCVIQLRLCFQSNLDTLADSGLRFDNVIFEYWPPYVNDISCYSLQVRYPNAVNRPFRITAYFRNEGINSLNDIQAWWRAGENPWRPFYGVFALSPNETVFCDTMLTVITEGAYTIQARSGLWGDQNPANDTATVASVIVAPEGAELLIGYDNRTMPRSFNFAPGSGPLVHFTPVRDSVVEQSYRLDRIRARFSEDQAGDREMRWHVYRDAEDIPGEEILDTLIVVYSHETGTGSYKDVSLPVNVNSWLDEDFWVWLETTNDEEPEHFPQVLGEDAEPWPDIHYYAWNGDGEPTPTAFFCQIQSVILDDLPITDDPNPIPESARLKQNFPNPFNSQTCLHLELSKSCRVTLAIYDVLGQRVSTLLDQTLPSGSHSAVFDANALPSGLYFCRMNADDFTETIKMLLLR
ncbi:MAG: T9SS type A sorting domain-containing protein [bacterium]|nr:T9SS type A sorting domain-containing protein [bacterium]